MSRQSSCLSSFSRVHTKTGSDSPFSTFRGMKTGTPDLDQGFVHADLARVVSASEQVLPRLYTLVGKMGGS